ncbi:uncharacterized protein NFIA_041170 [Aspergillus fischeri NRRL 181]|uniref:Uncharacterized protein n=1 Tax=Neosartorya fischeri (strain ATCC 1020 / DSM 3700 / CBS 544.65 / FGSC A1164 / JCM 1740 / NRRL 181 / WB 181) TaxID=331117 RepID=A1D0L9_NEOFI|nr:uncharacterized protein NFIA_041170 [Aspergillus fischeri NRRL 181]EAW24539.1 hypothetical protein NFIA_041170 [Aspergillus fischeri NRRL 181]
MLQKETLNVDDMNKLLGFGPTATVAYRSLLYAKDERALLLFMLWLDLLGRGDVQWWWLTDRVRNERPAISSMLNSAYYRSTPTDFMSQFTFFSYMHWRNLTLSFLENDLHSLSSSWKVIWKLNEGSDSYTQEEAQTVEEFPLACARFKCGTLEYSGNKAIFKVYTEIPCEDTE